MVLSTVASGSVARMNARFFVCLREGLPLRRGARGMERPPILALLLLGFRGSGDALDDNPTKLYGSVWGAKHLPSLPGTVVQQEGVIVSPASDTYYLGALRA